MILKLASPLDKIMPLEGPADFDRQLSCLIGETASFQVAWKLDAGARPAMVKISATGGARVRRVMNVPVRLAAYPDADCDTRLEPGLYPDLLRDWPHSFRAYSQTWEAAWIDATFDAPGDHEIRVTLSDEAGCELGSVAQRFRVVAAKLPPQTLIHTKWLHLDGICRIYKVEPFTEEFYKMLEPWIKLAVSRGINMILTPIHTPPLDTQIGGERMTTQLVDVYPTPDGYRFGMDKFKDWIRRLSEWGVEYFEIAHLFSQWGAKCAPKIVSADGKQLFGWDDSATGERYANFVGKYVEAIVQAIREMGVEKRCYFHISDEPSGEEARENYIRCKALVKEQLKGFTIMDALSDVEFYKSGAVDLPVPANNHIGPFLDEHIDGLWTYYCCGQYKRVSNMFIAMPSWRNRILGWQLYKYQIAGFLQWGYNYYNAQISMYPIDPYFTTDGDGAYPAGDPFQVYPGADGAPEESIRMMVTFHALQDLRALKLLESLRGREAALKIAGEITFEDYPRDMNSILDMRDAVNAEIEKAL